MPAIRAVYHGSQNISCLVPQKFETLYQIGWKMPMAQKCLNQK